VVGCCEPPAGSIVIATSISGPGMSMNAPFSGSRTPTEAIAPSSIAHSW